jgi:hypothetical protein
MDGLGFKPMNITESKKEANGEHVNNRRISLPVRYSPLLHSSMCTKPGFVLIERSVGKTFAIEAPNCLNCLHSFGDCGARNYFSMVA